MIEIQVHQNSKVVQFLCVDTYMVLIFSPLLFFFIHIVDVHLIMAATDGSNLITFQYLANGNQSFHFDVIQCLI